jgi:sugar O-acyltransferase (sialic acid O-acetyltransferase NeuD family)
MLVVGAGGLATQLFEDFKSIKDEQVVFWSETETKYLFLKEHFSFISSDAEAVEYFKNISTYFILCVGGVDNRKRLLKKFTALGGVCITFISPRSTISPFATIGNGTLILSRVEIEAHAVVGENCLFNKTANIGHGCIIGSNCEITPGVILTGEVELGNDCSVGTGTIILPKIKVGNNVTLAAGSIVKKDVPNNAVVAGEFASVKFYKKDES